MNHDSDSTTRDYETLVRAALLGAGTSVWEWNPQTDALSGVDSDMTLLGYGPEETRLTQLEWNQLIHPDDVADNEARYQEHAHGESPFYEHEYRARTREGQWRWIAERGRIVEWSTDGKPLRVVGTLVDVTQRHQAESRALAIAAQLSETARHVPGVIYQYRHNGEGDGAFCYVSESCFDVLGLTASEVMRDGAAVLRMIERAHYGPTIAAMKLSARTLTPWRFDFRLRRPDGALRWMTGTSTPQRESDGGVLWYGYFEDSTQVHELQMARQSAAMAQAANRAKTEFLSHMSHELRTPLNAINGFSEIMAGEMFGPLGDPKYKGYAADILKSGQHLLSLINDILDMAKIEAGKLTLHYETVSVKEVVSDAARLMRGKIEEAGLTLLVDAPALPDIEADHRGLKQVVLNLISNAVKFTPEGGEIVVALSQLDDHRVKVAVTDTGIGIAPEDLARLARPFEQVEGQHSKTTQGTGLGLALTKALIELHGGELKMESEPGRGTTVSFDLPIRKPGTANAPAADQARAA